MATAKDPTEKPVTIRVRTLTAKGHELYLGTARSYDEKVSLAKRELTDLLETCKHGSELHDAFFIYSKMVSDYLTYLKGIHTADSNALYTSVSEDYNAIRE